MIRRAIVVGLGSIGQRHARLLADAGLAVSRVSRREGQGDFTRIADAVAADPEALLVIATETDRHIGTLQEARSAGHRGAVVIEKPLARRPDELEDIGGTDRIWVAYNLRFAPVVAALRGALEDAGEAPLAARMHVGQHLHGWRPGTETAASYSAHAARGGGALRDLSHELDLATWLWGRPTGVCALGGRRAAVTVDSDDCWTMVLQTDKGVDVALSLNYLDQPATRYIHVNTASHTFQADLIANALLCDGIRTDVPNDRDTSYRGMWADLLGAIAAGRAPRACSYAEGAEIMNLIADCETSARGPRWIER